MISIKREDIKEFLFGKVLPKIREPQEDLEKPIFIQQDNARTLVDPRGEDFRAATSCYSFDICLMCQPPNSPDLNILDLGFFSVIQTLQYKVGPKTIENFIFVVNQILTNEKNQIFLSPKATKFCKGWVSVIHEAHTIKE